MPYLSSYFQYLKETSENYPQEFEKFVLNILNSFLTFNKRTLKIDVIEHGSAYFNAVASDGIPNFSNSVTYIDITVLSLQSHRSIATWILRSIRDIKKSQENCHFLIIHPVDLTKEQKQLFFQQIRKEFPEKLIEIWGPLEFEPLIEQYAEYSADAGKASFISNKALENIVSKSITHRDWRQDRDQKINILKNIYKKRSLTLFLGAGVSMSADLPDWTTLLSKLLISLITNKLQANRSKTQQHINLTEKEIAIIANALRSLNNNSFLIEARYINAGLGEEFIDEVSKVLYPEKIRDSPLLKTIAKLCVPRRNNCGVNTIVTYNFDDLIEEELTELNIEHKTIFSDNDYPENGEIGIYHVHGFIPRTSLTNRNLERGRIIFSERQYHELMQDPYDWSNLIQLQYLKEDTCVLIGLSGTDPNLRRILEIVKGRNKTSKHFIFFERVSNIFFEKIAATEQINLEVIDTISDIHHSMIESSFNDLGINIIWYKTKDEISDLINKIRE